MFEFAGSNRRSRGFGALVFSMALGLPMSPAVAQQPAESHDHSQHGTPPEDHSQHDKAPQDHSSHQAAPAATKSAPATTKPPAKHSGHPASHGAMRHAPPGKPAAHSEHGGGTHDQHGGMRAFLGPYALTREGSGTSWVPDTTPHEGIHGRVGEWSTMWHSYLNLIYDRQGGPRGGDKTFTNGMIMGMAQRPLGDGTLGLRAMLSPRRTCQGASDRFVSPSQSSTCRASRG